MDTDATGAAQRILAAFREAQSHGSGALLGWYGFVDADDVLRLAAAVAGVPTDAIADLIDADKA